MGWFTWQHYDIYNVYSAQVFLAAQIPKLLSTSEVWWLNLLFVPTKFKLAAINHQNDDNNNSNNNNEQSQNFAKLARECCVCESCVTQIGDSSGGGGGNRKTSHWLSGLQTQQVR